LPRGFGQPAEKIADVDFNILYLSNKTNDTFPTSLMIILPIEL